MKKAMVERMKGHYNVTWFPEDGASFPLRVFLYKDVVTVGIDTSGDSCIAGLPHPDGQAPSRRPWPLR